MFIVYRLIAFLFIALLVSNCSNSLAKDRLLARIESKILKADSIAQHGSQQEWKKIELEIERMFTSDLIPNFNANEVKQLELYQNKFIEIQLKRNIPDYKESIEDAVNGMKDLIETIDSIQN